MAVLLFLDGMDAFLGRHGDELPAVGLNAHAGTSRITLEQFLEAESDLHAAASGDRVLDIGPFLQLAECAAQTESFYRVTKSDILGSQASDATFSSSPSGEIR